MRKPKSDIKFIIKVVIGLIAAYGMIVLFAGRCSGKSEIFGWEVANTNSLPVSGEGTRISAAYIGPFPYNVTLQSISVSVSMAPTDGWPYVQGLAELLVFGVIPGQSAEAEIREATPSIWQSSSANGGGLFQKILKMFYPGAGAVNLDSTIPLYDLPLPVGQSIIIEFQYYSATVAGDVEIGGSLQYAIQ